MKHHKGYIISLLLCALALPFTGCKRDKDKMKHDKEAHYSVKKEYRDYTGEHSYNKGQKHRDEMRGKARRAKEKVQRKMCKMCGGKTEEGKCVVCGK